MGMKKINIKLLNICFTDKKTLKRNVVTIICIWYNVCYFIVGDRKPIFWPTLAELDFPQPKGLWL